MIVAIYQMEKQRCTNRGSFAPIKIAPLFGNLKYSGIYKYPSIPSDIFLKVCWKVKGFNTPVLDGICWNLQSDNRICGYAEGIKLIPLKGMGN